MATDRVRIQQPVKFGDDFELDPISYELRRAGIPIKLEPTPFGILALLVEQRGALVSRQQIVERIWGKGVFLDTDNSINGGIRKIRQALHDDPENPKFVQTVTGRGYRFVAPVEENKPQTQATPTLAVLQSPKGESKIEPSPSSRLRPALTIAAFLVLVAVLVLWLVPAISHRTTASAPIRSIAVLPLDNLSGDSSQDYFADAMTDELITDLAKVHALRVTSRTTITLYKHTNKPLPEIARELNVDAIVEGSVMRSGQRVRITAQLIHAPADQHVWAESYERDLGDALRLQSDVAQAITQQVRAQLTPELKEQFSGTRPVDPEAYDAYLKGRYYLYNQDPTGPGVLDQAKTNFEEAIRKDPNFSSAYSGLAEAYIFLVIFGRGQITAADGYQLARNAVQKALELDPNNGEAYNALGELSWNADLDWKAAGRLFNKALALAPSYSCAHEDRAMLMALMGNRDEALMELEKVKQIVPGPDSLGIESAVYFQLRDWEHLRGLSQARLASDPNDSNAHADMGTAYEGTGKLPEAIAEYQKAVELSNGDLDRVASLGHAYAAIGNRAEAQKILHDIEEKSKSGKASPYLAATIYAGLGQKDKAMGLIEEAYREKSLDVAWILKSDVRTDNLRSDPRFQTLLRRVGLQN